MSDIIDFLERLGQDAQWHHAGSAAVAAAVARLGAEPALQSALLSGDQRLLESLLGAAPHVCCIVFSPDEEEEEKDAA